MEVLTWRGLVRYWVCFVIDIKTRRVEIAGITCAPTGAWMQQIARNLTDVEDGFLRGVRYLILDRDPLYTEAFRNILKDSGVEALRLPARSPNLNAYAERFVLSVKSEALNRIVPLGERHLRRTVSAFMSHYHGERHAAAATLRGLPSCGDAATHVEVAVITSADPLPPLDTTQWDLTLRRATVAWEHLCPWQTEYCNEDGQSSSNAVVPVAGYEIESTFSTPGRSRRWAACWDTGCCCSRKPVG